CGGERGGVVPQRGGGHRRAAAAAGARAAAAGVACRVYQKGAQESMKKPRALALLLCACLAALPLGGCLRSQTLDESEYVLAIGFDAGDAFAYRFSFAVQRINAESSEPRAEGFT